MSCIFQADTSTTHWTSHPYVNLGSAPFTNLQAPLPSNPPPSLKSGPKNIIESNCEESSEIYASDFFCWTKLWYEVLATCKIFRETKMLNNKGFLEYSEKYRVIFSICLD